MARVPSIIDQVNYAMSIKEDPCNGPPWIVNLTMAGPPAGEAVITMLTFGWDDVARGYFRPRGLYRGKKARKTPRATGRLHRLAGFFRNVPGIGDDPGDIIGRRLPGAKTVKGRAIRSFEKVMWLIDNKLQRALFFWLVIDVVEEFWYDWTSLLMASEFCNRAFGAALYMSGPGGSFPALAGFRGTFHDDFRWEEGGLNGKTAAVGLPAGQWTVTSAIIVRNVSSQLAYFVMQLRTGGADPHIFDEVRTPLIPPVLVGHCIVSAEITGPEQVFIMGNAFMGSMVGVEIHTTVMGNPLGFVPPDLPPCERL